MQLISITYDILPISENFDPKSPNLNKIYNATEIWYLYRIECIQFIFEMLNC